MSVQSQRLRDLATDWDGSPRIDGWPYRNLVSFDDVRKAADEIEGLEQALNRKHHRISDIETMRATFEEMLRQLTTISGRAYCKATPMITLTFASPADRHHFVNQMKNDWRLGDWNIVSGQMLLIEAGEPFELDGVKITFAVREN